MKKITYLAITFLVLVSCGKETKSFVTFSGQITNKEADSMVITEPRSKFKRVIKIDANGAFKDTINVKKGIYNLFYGRNYTSVYLRNGDDIQLSFDTKKFYESTEFSGKGANESNFLAKSNRYNKEFFSDPTIIELPKEAFDAKMASYFESHDKMLKENVLDTSFVSSQYRRLEDVKRFLVQQHEEKSFVKNKLAKGIASPKFVNYENHKGGTTSLDDFKGKYVYIDLWATWCKPCKDEIPHLKKIEKQFHNKNIEFVSISLDSKKLYDTWKQMVVDKQMSGVQLFAKEDRSFEQAYRVTGIPRFILIDKEGNIVDANAPRPSNPKLVTLLESLEI